MQEDIGHHTRLRVVRTGNTMMKISRIIIRTSLGLHYTSLGRLTHSFNVVVWFILMVLTTRAVALIYLHQYHPHILIPPTKVFCQILKLPWSRFMSLNGKDCNSYLFIRFIELFRNAAYQIHQTWYLEGKLYLVVRSWYVELPSTTNLMRLPKRGSMICKFSS